MGCNVLNDIAAEAGDIERLVGEREASPSSCPTRSTGSSSGRSCWRSRDGPRSHVGDRGAGRGLRFAEARSYPGALDVAWSGVAELRAREWSADAEGLRSIAERLERLVLPGSRFWGAWAPYARARADLLDGRLEAAFDGATRALELARAVRERRIEWRAAFVAAKALEALGRHGDAVTFRDDAAAVVRSIAAVTSGGLRETFLARPDVAELLA